MGRLGQDRIHCHPAKVKFIQVRDSSAPQESCFCNMSAIFVRQNHYICKDGAQDLSLSAAAVTAATSLHNFTEWFVISLKLPTNTQSNEDNKKNYIIILASNISISSFLIFWKSSMSSSGSSSLFLFKEVEPKRSRCCMWVEPLCNYSSVQGLLCKWHSSKCTLLHI